MKQYLFYFLLIIVFLVGIFIRTYHLSSLPFGFFSDEAAIGYNAFTIGHTGYDEYGKFLPIFFESFGDYKDPIAIYSTVPFVLIFSLTEFAIRIPSVLYGLVTIVFLYFLTKEVESKRLAFWTTTVAASMPWLIHYNRIGFELNEYCAFWVITMYFLSKIEKNSSYIIPFFVSLGLTWYTYQPAKLLVLLLLIAALSIYRNNFFKKKLLTLIGLIIFVLISIPLIISFTTGQATARFSMVSVLNTHLSIGDLCMKIVTNYFTQLSPSFFFIGEPTFITRHFTGGLLPLLLITIPFIILGIGIIIKHSNKKICQLLLFWLLVYPLGGAFVADAPFTSRSIIGAPLFAILTALGICDIVSIRQIQIPQLFVKIIIFCGICINFIFFGYFYFTVYPLYSSDFWGWQYGAKDIITYFSQHEASYDEEIMEPAFNAPNIFFKFYAPNNCNKCKVGLLKETYNAKKKQLFALSDDYLLNNPNARFITLKYLYYPNGKIAFHIGTIVR